MANAAELDAVWRQAVAEFDRGLTVAKMMLKRGQFVSAMQAIEQCQALLGVMDGIQKTAHVVPIDELTKKVREAFGMPDSPEDVEAEVDRQVSVRDPYCVSQWPECADGAYDPRCCRFPKSCSASCWPGNPTWIGEADG